MAEALGEHGVATAHVAEHDELTAFAPDAWARVLVDEMGHDGHIDLSGLTVPTLVIGSTSDRLLPMCQARKIAEAAPNLVELVEMPGGHCALLEHPEEVNNYLRDLAVSSTRSVRISS